MVRIPTPLLYLPLDGDLTGRDRAGSIVPTNSGPTRYVDGFVLTPQPAAVNLIPNPSAEISTAGWTKAAGTNGAKIDFSRSTEWAKDGVASFKIQTLEPVYATAYSGNFVETQTVPGQSYSVSYWAYTTAIDVSSQAWIGFYNAAGDNVNYHASLITPLIPGVPTLVKVENKTIPAGSVRAGLEADFFGPGADVLPAGVVVHFDSAMWSRDAFLPTYFDGSMGGVHSWTGAPHASASTRVAIGSPTRGPAAVNHVPNPRFSAWPSLWNAANNTYTIVDEGGYSSLRFTRDSAPGTHYIVETYSFDGVVGGQTYTESFYAECDQPGRSVFPNVLWFDSNGSYLGENGPSPVELEANTPTHITYSVFIPVGASKALIRMRIPSTGDQSGNWKFSRPQFEVGPVATPYLDGSMGIMHSWNGPPHASASTRVASEYPILGPAAINWWPNPSAAESIGMVGWLNNTVERVVSGAETWFLATAKAAEGFGLYSNLPVPASPGQNWIMSVDVYSDTGLHIFPGIECYNSAGAYIGGIGTATQIPTGQWTRLSNSLVTPAGTVRVTPVVYTSASGPVGAGLSFRARRAQFENQPVATPYFDGSMGGVHSWLGVPYASASKRRATADQALFVEEGTTNHIQNPAVQNNLTGIDGGTRDTAVTYFDPISGQVFNSVRYETPGTGADEGGSFICGAIGGATTVRTFTGQVMVLYPVGITYNVVIRLQVNGNATPRDNVITIIGTGQWQKVTGAVTSNNGDTIDSGLIIIASSWSGVRPGARTFWATAAQLEEKSYATTYADGAVGAGYSWAGAAHGSASTRYPAYNAVIQAGHINNAEGEVIFQFRQPIESSTPNAGWFWHVGAWNSSTVDFLGFLLQNDQAVLWYWGGVNQGFTQSQPASKGSDHIVSVRWTSTEITFQVDGGDPGTIVRTASTGSFGAGLLYLGSDGGQVPNAAVGSYIIFDGPLTDEERETAAFLMESGAYAWHVEGFGSLPFGEGPFGGTIVLPEGYAPPSVYIRHEQPSGRFYVEPRIWKSDIYQTKLEPLSPALPIRGAMTFNDDFEHKRQFTMELANPDSLKPLEDFVVPELYMSDGHGKEWTIPLGHFLVTPPTITMTPALRRGTIEGKDLTYLLSRSALNGSYLVDAGSDTGESARETLVRFGIPARMVDIPNSGAYLPKDLKWEAGDSVLTATNDLLLAGAQYHVWTTGRGILTSRKYDDASQQTPATTYSTEEGSRLIPPVTETPDWSRLRNRVIVRKLSPDELPIIGRAEVRDRSSPLHPDRLKERMGASYPVYLSHTDEASDIVDQASANLRAASLLSEGASFYRKVNIETIPDEYMDGHLIIGLDIREGGTTYYGGNWLQRVFSLDMSGAKATVRRELNSSQNWK